MNTKSYDVIIIGGGPAGFTAGIYAARGGLKTLIFTGADIGGQATQTHAIENYSGQKNISGFDLVSIIMEQAQSFGAEVEFSAVESVDLTGNIKKLKADTGENFEAKSVIIATGAGNRKLGIPMEDELIGRGIGFCATCDGGFFKDKKVAVAGGGNSALTEAMYLSNICEKVYLIHRRQGFRAAQIMVDRVKNNPKIELVLDSVVTELKGLPLSSVVVTNKVTNETREIELSGLFVAVGKIPNSDLFKTQLELDEYGYIVADSNMETSIKGVFVAGDVRNTPLRQVITACADGAIAANSAIDYLATV